MSDDLTVLPGVGNDSQGEGGTKAEDEGARLNLTDLPEFREYQRNADRRYESERQRRLEAERQAAALAARASTFDQVLQNIGDPDLMETVSLAAENAEMRARLREQEAEQERLKAQAEHQRQVQAYIRQQEQRAARYNIPATDGGLNAAIRRALDTGDNSPVDDYIVEWRSRGGQPTPANQPQRQPSSSPLPPQGGASVQTVEKLRQEYQERKSNLRQGDIDGLFRLRQEYRAKGYDPPL